MLVRIGDDVSLKRKLAIFALLKAFRILKPIKELSGGKVTGNVNVTLQILAIFVQIANGLTDIVPSEYKPIVLAVVALGQAVLAKIAIDRNADGKSSSYAFDPLTKKSIEK